MDYVLQSQNLVKSFGKVRAVDNVNIHVPKGSIYGLVGRNGAGKTTFMKMAVGLTTASQGNIEIFGKKGFDIAEVRKEVGNLVEAPGIYGNLTAFDNLKAKCIFMGVKDQKDYINNLLELVGLGKTGSKKTKKFSLGMKQRLGIAMAMVGDPELLILDEPINGLDPQGVAEMRDMLTKINKEKGTTIVISSHILSELSKVATCYGFIEQGKLVKEISSEDLFEECKQHVKLIVDNIDKTIEVAKSIGIENYKVKGENSLNLYDCEERSAEINKALNDAGVAVSEIKIGRIDLESYFFNLINGVGVSANSEVQLGKVMKGENE